MFDRFQHYLSYGSTDQQTVRELSAYFDGLIVPGTIAAFQAEGTKGFVLSLSARSNTPYVIDSRFPLFQNQLSTPKKSHLMLADVLGVPSLVNRYRLPLPTDFDETTVEQIARAWIDFNVGYEDVQTKTFDKYASRLNEPVLRQNREDPAFILPPYAMVGDHSDGWGQVSERLWSASCEYAEGRGVRAKLRRVIAAHRSDTWGALASSVGDDEVVAWVSGLDEFNVTSEPELIAYGRALQGLQSRNQDVFALYGGFLSVLFSRHGLNGSSHGIGFGEYRDWVELPSSGAPPARYYVPKLHKYIAVDVADAIWRQFPALIACDCDECGSGSPNSLDYHALMRHSVRARYREIQTWLPMPTAEVIKQLNDDSQSFKSATTQLAAPSKVIRRAADSFAHLAMWARIMRALE